MAPNAGETSAAIRARVSVAREQQLMRQVKANALLDNAGVELHCRADAAGEALLKQAIARFGLSARAYHRILKVARTLADLAGERVIGAAQVAEAVQYRRMVG